VAAVRRENEWKAFEDQQRGAATPSAPRGRLVHQSSSHFAGVDLQFNAGTGIGMNTARAVHGSKEAVNFINMKHYFLDGVLSCPEFAEALEGLADADFPFWHYIGGVVRSGVNMAYKIQIITWILFLITLFCFCLLHRFLHVGWIRIMIVMIVVLVGQIGFMYYSVRREQGNIQKGVRKQTVLTNKTPTMEDTSGFLLQFPTFFISYAIARLLCSPFTWIYFPRLSILMLLMGFAFFLFYRFVVAPVAIMFFVMCGLPPHLDNKDLKAVKHTIATSKDPSFGSRQEEK